MRYTLILITFFILNNLYSQCISGDCINGYGKWNFNDGVIEGEWKNGKLNGSATYTGNQGDVFTGKYVEGARNGKGKYQWKNGEIYDGDWKDGQRTGKGKYFFANGALYEGDFVNGKFHGKGIITWTNGEIYDGDWLNDQNTGKGKYFYPNGDFYEGNFVNGVKTGKGKQTSKDGNTYDGDWLNGQATGKGKYFYANGDVYEGDFVDGKFNGRGKYQWPNGNKYDGEWINGQRSDKGQKILAENQKSNSYVLKNQTVNSNLNLNENSNLSTEKDKNKYGQDNIPPKWIEEIQDKVTKESVQLKWRENKKEREMSPDFLNLGFYRYLDYIEDRTGLDRKLYYGDIPYSGTYSYQNTAFNRIKTITSYKDGYRDGKEIVILNDSTISESNYIGGRRFGLQNEFYENGKIRRYGNLINGNGILTEWYDNGKIASESNYKNGLLNGIQKVYSSINEKELISELNYKEGKLEGHSSDRGRFIGNYSRGKLNGIQKFLDGNNYFEMQYSMDTFNFITERKKHIKQFEPGERKIEQIFGLNNKNYLSGFESIFVKQNTTLYLQSQGVIKRSNLNFTEEEVVDFISACGANMRSDFILGEVKKAWIDYKFCTITKDSIWKTWHFNGQLESEGNYINNLQDGLWKTWFENGQLKSEENFNLGKKDGLCKNWHSNGKLALSGSYISEQKNGSWKLYNEAGQLTSEENYARGKMNGLFTKYFNNGKLSFVKNYINDIKDGNWKTYNEKGIVTQEEFYKNGKKDGIFITRHSNGIKSSEATYKNDALVGEFKRFDEKGNRIIPQVVTNNNVNQNNSNNYQNVKKEECFNCKGTGQCPECTKIFNCSYYIHGKYGNGHYESRPESKPGYIMCNNCMGSGYSKGYWENRTHDNKCYVGNCINGWVRCNKCYSNELGKCWECHGTGY